MTYLSHTISEHYLSAILIYKFIHDKEEELNSKNKKYEVKKASKTKQ